MVLEDIRYMSDQVMYDTLSEGKINYIYQVPGIFEAVINLRYDVICVLGVR